MRTLLNKIKKLLKDRRTRRLWSRTISIVAALVVFVTTYALVLPAITMERQAYCGLEAHQHTDDCFERQLICTIPESPGHHHDDSCYTMRQEYSCTLEEHTHADGCYDEEGNLICEIPEHTHEEGTCWQEVPELTCTLEESDGHQHDDSCYENVLVCGKEVHTHSEACYENPDALLETAAVATTQEGAYGISSDEGFDGAGTDGSADSDGSGDEIGWTDSDEYGNAARSDATDMNASDGDNDGTALGGENDGSAGSQEAADGMTDPDNAANDITAAGADAAGADASGSDAAGTDNLSEEAQQDLTSAGINEEEDRYVPQLEPLAFDSALRSRTGIYYYHVREGETIEDSSLITEWKKVDKNTELGPNDLLRVYLSYTIPAGSLNETNPTASYRLPANLHLTDDQVNGINAVENGIAAAYIDYNTLTVTDPDNYHKYLGAEAVEGTRTPDQTLEEYLAQNKGGSGSGDSSGSNAGDTGGGMAAGQEFISATVRAQNVYDTEGLYGEKGAYLGQDLIFTFSPYTIEKNQHTYDASGQPTRAGQKVRGWFALDFNLTQVDLDEPYIEEVENFDNIENIEVESDRENENTGENTVVNTGDENAAVSDDDSDTTVLISREFRTANIVFVEKNDSLNLDEISASIKVVTAENYERVEANPDDAENTENIEENGEEQLEENAEGIEEDLTGQEAEAGEDAEGTDNEDKSDADDEDKKKEDLTAEDEKDKDKTVSQDDESEKTIMPAMSFEDSIRVRTGKPAGVEDGSAGSAAASAAEALPKKAKVTVRVEADEGTFPAGTTMVLSAVEDMDTVAETVKETVENGGTNDSTQFSDSKSNKDTPAAENHSDTASASSTENKNPKTYGFQAVDISFRDADGYEIEPAKPVRVALTSEIIEQIKADKETNENTSIADPIVVHLDDDGKAEKMDLIAPEEIQPAQGKTEEELREELEKAEGGAEKTVLEQVEKTAAEQGEKDREDTNNRASESDQAVKDDSEKMTPEGSDENPAPAEMIRPDLSKVETVEMEDQNQEHSNTDDQLSEGEDTANAPAVFFDTDSFSVYAIVYTVDFLWEVNGRSFKFNIPGGGFVSFSKLFEAMGIASGKEINTDVIDLNDILASDNTEEISEETRSFVAGIEKMEFSRPDLLWVGLAEEDTTVSSLRARLSLDAEYSASIKPEEIDKINETEIEKGDWVLLSVKAFETQETLTVTMKDGELFTILVTDEQNAIMNPDGQTVQTIPNPSGTTINMFDYWIDNETEVARRGWLGYRRSGTTGYDSSFWNYFDDQNTNTNGNNVGINYNHRLKFLPSMGGQVQDWETDGTYHATSSDGRIAGINSWNGKNENNTNKYNGEPTTGIVANALYNSSGALDPDGYPRLNSSLGGESLNYLFNPETGHSGKRSYTRANNLFYVDPDGYYTYDSMDYSASMNKSTKQFTLREQPTNDNRAGIRGFWPMGDLNYWLGMHLKAEFSMPQNGEVLNPKGVYKPMEFQFSGDDDAWAYVDGILVADGGGIHNRTELDIDFKTGIVKVIGGTYTDLSNPDMTVVSERTLYQIFSQAHSNGLISNDKWNSYEWADYDGDGTPDTFAQGTNLTFDFFYLERGGGESNLYIHYNLISTTDFSAHKSYHMLQNDPNARLQRDQFKFELIGFDEPGNEGETIYAVMPDKGTPGGDGSFESPQKVHNNSAPGGAGVPDGMTAHTSLIIGVTEDGNINFGDVEISGAYEGKEYKYMVREIVPDDAVNADGVRWDAADESLKAEGGFIKDGITYDGRIYYFKGKVYETESGKYELKKTRYTDSTYTEIDDQTKFFSFVNGYVRPLTFKVLKRNETGETPLDGAQFTLTRAMQDQDGKWVVRTYQNGGETIEAASRSGTTSNGEVSFNNLTEGHFILEETAAPSGYEKGDPCRWLLTLTKQDSDTEILLIPTIQGLSSDGTLIGESRTLDTDMNNVAEYQILNQPKMIRLTLTKEWMGGAPDNSEVTFELKRYRSYDKPGAPLKSTLNVYRVPDGFDLSRGVLEWSKEFAANTTARVRWTYDYWMGSVWKDGLYRIDNGANQNAGSSGGTFSVYVPMPSQGAVNLYIRDGNMYGDYSQHQVRVSEPTGTAPSSQPSNPEHITELDPTFTGHTFAFPVGTTNWSHTFEEYPAVGINETYQVQETYSYFIEEVTGPEGYEVSYDRMNGNDIAGSSDSENRVITNRKKTEVPVNKTWKWSEEDEGRAVSWDATFVLEYRETLVSGEPASDAQHTWAAVSGAASKTIHKGDTGDAITFRDLPMYREHSNGSVYRIIYAVDEIAYHVYDSSDHLIARWTKDGSESQIGTLYAPDYEQDAGELDQPEDYADWPAWYTISLINIVHETKVTNTIDLGIRKIWEDESIHNTDGAYAKFQLKRYVHEEYRDFSKEGIDTSQPVTVTLDLGEGRQTQITVPKGAPVHISGMAKPEHSVELTFTKPDSTSLIMQLDNSESVRQAVADTESFNPQSDCTISFAHGNTDAIIGGLDGLRLACYYDRQTPQIDTSFNTEHDGYLDPSGQVFTLSNANHWQKEWAELPQIVEGKLNGDLQTVYVYSYFLEETESYPEGYVSIFKNSAGEELGDRYIPVDFNTTITAENVETTAVTVRKVWDDDNNEDRPESLTITLLSDGTRTDKTVTLNEANNWEDSIGDLPKYNDGVAIDYEWIEEEMPSGYFLTNISTSEGETGTITTLTNSLSKYDIKTSYIGVKNWDDVNNQYLTRPHDLAVSLYADGQLTGHTAEWTEGLQENQWTYIFRDLPVFTETGEIIQYTAEEEPVPGGYTESHTATDTDGQIGTITYDTGSNRITLDDQQNKQIVWTLGSVIDLAFIAIKPKANGDVFVWTSRTPVPGEVTAITNKIRSGAIPGAANRNIYFSSGIGDVTTPQGSVHVTFDEAELRVVLDFGSTEVWNHFIVGQFNGNDSSNYEPGTTTFTNRLRTTSLSGSKTWAIPADTEHPDPVLKLTRTTTGIDIDGTPIVSDPEVVQIKVGNDMVNLQPQWSGDGATMRSFTYNDLPQFDPAGKEYTYSVEEVSFTIGSGEDTVVYTVVKNPDGRTYTVTSDPADAEVFVVTQEGNSITNSPLQVSIEIIKVEKGHKDSSHTLSGAKFRLLRVNESNDNNFAGEGSYQSEKTVDPETGTVTFEGLKPGRYKLEETESPDGYILVETPWFITVDRTGAAHLEASYSMASTAGDNSFYIENEPGAVLPSSGGPGTKLFTILGSVLIVGAALLLRRRRKTL